MPSVEVRLSNICLTMPGNNEARSPFKMVDNAENKPYLKL